MSAILNYINQRGSVQVLLFPVASKEHAHAALSTIHKERDKNKKKDKKNRRVNETLKRYVYFLSLFPYSLFLSVCSHSLPCFN